MTSWNPSIFTRVYCIFTFRVLVYIAYVTIRTCIFLKKKVLFCHEDEVHISSCVSFWTCPIKWGKTRTEYASSKYMPNMPALNMSTMSYGQHDFVTTLNAGAFVDASYRFVPSLWAAAVYKSNNKYSAVDLIRLITRLNTAPVRGYSHAYTCTLCSRRDIIIG